jgi:hypothetical protein
VFLAAALQVLWPVAVTSNAASDALSQSGAPHDHAATHAGGEGAPVHDDEHHSTHCGFCSTAAVNAVLAPHDMSGAWNILDAGAAGPVAPDLPPPVSAFEPSAYPRGPPLLS